MAERFKSTGPSQRQQRVGELIRHALAEIFARGEIHDEMLAGLSPVFPEVKLSPDLKLATIFVAPLTAAAGEPMEDKALIAALVRNRKTLRHLVAERINLRYAPDLRFRRDDTFEEAQRIEELLRSDKVRRDLGPVDPPDEDDD